MFLTDPPKGGSGVWNIKEEYVDNSIEFARDTDGVPQWTIKLYFNNDDLDNIVDKIKMLDNAMNKCFKSR